MDKILPSNLHDSHLLIAQQDRKLRSLRETIAFFASVIKSGESWSATCDQYFINAYRDDP